MCREEAWIVSVKAINESMRIKQYEQATRVGVRRYVNANKHYEKNKWCICSQRRSTTQQAHEPLTGSRDTGASNQSNERLTLAAGVELLEELARCLPDPMAKLSVARGACANHESSSAQLPRRNLEPDDVERV